MKNITPAGRNSVGVGVGNDYSCTAIQEMSDGVFVGILNAGGVCELVPAMTEEVQRVRLKCLVAEVTGSLWTACSLGQVSAHTASVHLILPHLLEEPQLRTIMDQLNHALRTYGITIAGGHTSVSAGAKNAFVSLEITGSVRLNPEAAAAYQKDSLKKMYASGSGLSDRYRDAALIITESVALEGTVLLAYANRDRLCGHFRTSFVDEVCSLENRLDVTEAARIAGAQGAVMHNLSEGGVLGGLWEFAEHCGLGLDVDLKAIPIRQETVEITEFGQVNPYQLRSAGALLIATEEPEALLEAYHKAGIPAARIGTFTNENAKIIRNADEVRYLDLPQMDAIYEKE